MAWYFQRIGSTGRGRALWYFFGMLRSKRRLGGVAFQCLNCSLADRPGLTDLTWTTGPRARCKTVTIVDEPLCVEGMGIWLSVLFQLHCADACASKYAGIITRCASWMPLLLVFLIEHMVGVACHCARCGIQGEAFDTEQV